ncbi:hypothetical protein [Amycolatopsis cihanbeyliensis]|uniref:Secreted protein n=1 Tax=Amycolatopsis cihanbeyliensis TaxID=1128664 RepID=A0A542DKU7_AMYCI|nr:hypothetical protein [Amycolatopsis cihanbeyliensis]TQJ03708.1 hypothetical protein FB471_3475 [Amycolatopsis cihanbeyliensis]
MSRRVLQRKSLPAKGFALTAAVATALLTAPAASATEPEPALVRATEHNACKLNVRAGAGTSTSILTTLTCDNYTTCVRAEPDYPPCSPFVVGERYSCVGTDDRQVTDDKWAEVAWRAPKPAYVAVACAAFRA